MRRFCVILTSLALSTAALAAPKDSRPHEASIRPSDRSINDRGERQTNMEAVEQANDRGRGYVSDPWIWDLDRIDAYNDRRYVPGREFQLLDQDVDRRLRNEDRGGSRDARQGRRLRDIARDEAQDAAAHVDLGIVPGDLASRSGGVSPLAAQLYEDEQTLGRAEATAARLLTQLDEAEARELGALRARLEREGRAADFDESAAKVRADYTKWREQARAGREQVRSRMTGKPATQPATTKPAEK